MGVSFRQSWCNRTTKSLFLGGAVLIFQKRAMIWPNKRSTVAFRPLQCVLFVLTVCASAHHAAALKSVVRVDSGESLVYLSKFGFLSDGSAQLQFTVCLIHFSFFIPIDAD